MVHRVGRNPSCSEGELLGEGGGEILEGGGLESREALVGFHREEGG